MTVPTTLEMTIDDLRNEKGYFLKREMQLPQNIYHQELLSRRVSATGNGNFNREWNELVGIDQKLVDNPMAIALKGDINTAIDMQRLRQYQTMTFLRECQKRKQLIAYNLIRKPSKHLSTEAERELLATIRRKYDAQRAGFGMSFSAHSIIDRMNVLSPEKRRIFDLFSVKLDNFTKAESSMGEKNLTGMSTMALQQHILHQNSFDVYSHRNTSGLPNEILPNEERSTKPQWTQRHYCGARGMKSDHNSSTAYFDIPLNTRHGQHLLCSHPTCREAGVKFRYCFYCRKPVTKQNFKARHSHPNMIGMHNNQNAKDSLQYTMNEGYDRAVGASNKRKRGNSVCIDELERATMRKK